MSRPDISMSTREVDAFLASESSAVLVALDPPGAPAGTVAVFRYDGGDVTVSIDPADPVGERIAADPRVCCVVERFPSYYGIAGVMLHGTAIPHGDGVYGISVEKVVSFDFGKLKASGA